jgi:hypothetical protein
MAILIYKNRSQKQEICTMRKHTHKPQGPSSRLKAPRPIERWLNTGRPKLKAQYRNFIFELFDQRINPTRDFVILSLRNLHLNQEDLHMSYNKNMR